MLAVTPLQVIFYVFATLAVGSAISVVTMRNPVFSVLSLVVTFFSMAAIWMLLRAEFLSLILLLVYVGAVMTLFLFVVMMLNIDVAKKRGSFVRYLPLGILLLLLFTGLLVIAEGPQHFGLSQMPLPAAEPADFSNIQHLGALLYTDYIYPFEIAGVLLLAAIIAAIVLAYHGPKHRRVEKPSKQISVNPRERLKLIKMPATKKPERQ